MSPHDSPDNLILGHNSKLYNKYLNQCIQTAKQEFYMHEFTKYKNDFRKSWDTLKHIINKKKSKSEIPPYFIDKDRRISGSQNIAEQFNKYFKSDQNLQVKLTLRTNYHLITTCKIRPRLLFSLIILPWWMLKKIISNSKPKSSTGYDNISSKLLKYIGDIVSVPLSVIVNQSLCTGIFPDKLKIAKVIPLYKKQDEKVFGNYRPISLLSSVSKVFERIVFDQSYDYFMTNGLLFNSQYGFRKHHSTELAALELTDKIRRKIDQKKTPFSVYLDLSKAFDTLNHAMLLKKLQYYGLRDTTLYWFKSYLSDRTQYVEYDGVASANKLVETSVPQGSILGPLLFVIYMNDIQTVSERLNFISYADATTLTSTLCTFTQEVNHEVNHMSYLINLELSQISDWLAVNKLSLNVDKTNFMIFHNHQKVTPTHDIRCLVINNTVVERVTEFKFWD